MARLKQNRNVKFIAPLLKWSACLLFVLFILCFGRPSVALAGAKFTFIVNNHTITITGYTDSFDNMRIPERINGLPVVGIAAYAFGDIIKSAYIPDSVTNIGDGAFANCINLTGIIVRPGNRAYSSESGVLFNKNKTVLIQYPSGKPGETYIIPDKVATISDYAFVNCLNLTHITIPNSTTSIGANAFSFDYNLAKVTIGDNVTDIGAYAFWDCSLTDIEFPSSLTNLGDGAFYFCTGLVGAYFDGEPPSIGSSVFGGDDSLIIYYVAGTPGWGSTFAGFPAVSWNP